MSLEGIRKTPPAATLLVGPTGAGKTPLAEILSARGLSGARLHHFDFGEELRQVGAGSVVPYSDWERTFVRRVLHEGALLEDGHFGLAAKIFASFLIRTAYRYPDEVILNGLPRHMGQAHDVASIASVTRMVVLDCRPSEVYERIRRNTGGDREGRLDDSLPLIEQKLLVYSQRTEPLVAHYEKKGVPVIRLEVDRSTTALQVFEELCVRIQDGCSGVGVGVSETAQKSAM